MDISSYFFANWVLVTNKTAQSWNECSCQLSILTEKWEVIAKRRITPYSRINLDQVGINGRKRYEFVTHSFGSDLKWKKAHFQPLECCIFMKFVANAFPYDECQNVHGLSCLSSAGNLGSLDSLCSTRSCLRHFTRWTKAVSWPQISGFAQTG